MSVQRPTAIRGSPSLPEMFLFVLRQANARGKGRDTHGHVGQRAVRMTVKLKEPERREAQNPQERTVGTSRGGADRNARGEAQRDNSFAESTATQYTWDINARRKPQTNDNLSVDFVSKSSGNCIEAVANICRICAEFVSKQFRVSVELVPNCVQSTSNICCLCVRGRAVSTNHATLGAGEKHTTWTTGPQA